MAACRYNCTGPTGESKQSFVDHDCDIEKKHIQQVLRRSHHLVYLCHSFPMPYLACVKVLGVAACLSWTEFDLRFLL